MRTLRLNLLIIGISLGNFSFGQPLTNNWVDQKEFCLSDENELADIWGVRGKSIPGEYFKELLPAFFERKLLFSVAGLGPSKLKWIFTGNDGGVTIIVSKDSVKLEQRYYNSFGFTLLKNPALKPSLAPRYPQQEVLHFEAALQNGNLQSIVLRIDHALGLTLYVNDSLMVRQNTQLDLSQHQLQVEGLKAKVCGHLQLPAIAHANITVNNDKKYQQILGFGGITSPVSYNMLSEKGKKQWWQFLEEYNLLIQREYPVSAQLKADHSNWDHQEDAVPHYYGDNFPNGELSDFEYNRKIQQMKGMVVFEFWKFPKWMLKNKGIPDYDKFTAAIIHYCQTAKTKTGMPPAIVGIQNELVQPAEVWEQMTINLRKALDKHGFGDVKIHMHNSNTLTGGRDALKVFSGNKEVWDNIDYTAANLYDYQRYFTNPDGYDQVIDAWNNVNRGREIKPFLSVEMSVNDNRYQSSSYRIAFLMGELYHKNMVHLNASSLMYCWLLLNNVQQSFSASRSLFEVDHSHDNIPRPSSYQLRTFGAFSRQLGRGMQRTEAVSADPDLLVSAYVQNSKQTVIILNKGTSSKKLSITGIKNISMMEVVSPYAENENRKISDLDNIVIAPGSILTLY